MAELFDFSWEHLTPAQIRAAGRVGVIRYVASGRGVVSATRAEVDSYRQAGLTFCGVWQNGDARPLGGYAAGQHDARDAHAYCATLGATLGDPVYFAVDFDATTAQMPLVVAYFRGVASVLGWPRTGAYGSHDVMAALVAQTPIGLLWQTLAWSAGRWHPAANLHQYAIEQTVAGSAVDFDRSLTAYYGQWGAMSLKSSARSGAPVLWVTIHTAEGPYDDDPANPSVDPGSVDQLRNYFANPATQASSHAGCDDDRLSDGWVPYDRAAWTLRNGNGISDNLEICGRAGWTRAQWLDHRPMVRNAARWAAGRCQARGIPARRLSTAHVAARNAAGIIDHHTYTVATGDGSHWDVGPGFPWDLFLADVDAYMQGSEPGEDDVTPQEMAEIKAAVKECQDVLFNIARGMVHPAPGTPFAPSAAHAGMAVTTATNRLSDLAVDVNGVQAVQVQAAAQLAAVAAETAGLRAESAAMRAELEFTRDAFTARLDAMGGGGSGGGGVAGDLQGTVTVRLSPAPPVPGDAGGKP